MRVELDAPSGRGFGCPLGSGHLFATMRLKLTAIRVFYDYLPEEAVRPDNPVGRGHPVDSSSVPCPITQSV